VKDYDAVDGEGPLHWSRRFDVSNWTLFTARVAGSRVGGATVAFDTPGLTIFSSLERRRGRVRTMAVEAAVVCQRLIDRVKECFVGRETTPIKYDATALPCLRRSRAAHRLEADSRYDDRTHLRVQPVSPSRITSPRFGEQVSCLTRRGAERILEYEGMSWHTRLPPRSNLDIEWWGRMLSTFVCAGARHEAPVLPRPAFCGGRDFEGTIWIAQRSAHRDIQKCSQSHCDTGAVCEFRLAKRTLGAADRGTASPRAST
jgi:hypothetical protein